MLSTGEWTLASLVWTFCGFSTERLSFTSDLLLNGSLRSCWSSAKFGEYFSSTMQSSTSRQRLKLDIFLVSGNSIFLNIWFSCLKIQECTNMGSLVYNIPRNWRIELHFGFVFIPTVLRTAAVEISLKSNSEFVDRNSTVCHYKHPLQFYSLLGCWEHKMQCVNLFNM